MCIKSQTPCRRALVEMCRIYVLYCPSCRHYSPISVVTRKAGLESRSRYLVVSDKQCRQFYCRRHLEVYTPWAPDRGFVPSGSCGEERCVLRQCCVIPVYRDCCRRWKDCLPEKWFVRKFGPPDYPICYSLAWAENACQEGGGGGGGAKKASAV